MNLRTGKLICNILEVARYLALFLGIYYCEGHYSTDYNSKIIIFSRVCVIAIAGLTGIEGLFFGKYASQIVGYSADSRYQKQSALNNLALASASILGMIISADVMYNLALLVTLLMFLFYSAINHGVDALISKNYAPRNLLRPIITLVLIYFSLSYIRHLW